LNESFLQVKNWLLSSGIAISSPNSSNYGSVHSFYNSKNSSFGFLYPEITGYYIDTLYFLFNLENQEKYKILVESSGNWLIKIFEKFGGIVMGIENEKPIQNIAFSFDTSICSSAMLKCHAMTNDSKFFKFAKNLLDWIIDGSIEEDGTILPFYDLKTKKFSENDQVWYKQKGCLNIKTAIPFFKFYQITNSQNYLKIAEKISNSYKIFQKSDGSFSIHENSSVINLHTQCYALEGLLFAFHVTKQKQYLSACEKALDWSVNHMENDGGIRLWFGNKYNSKAIYPIAQLIRLMILFDSYEKKSKYQQHVVKLMTFLLTFQEKSQNPQTHGGFYEESNKSIFGWSRNHKINSWGSMFALQALSWFQNYGKLNFEREIEYLY